MICTNCKQARLEIDIPCPHCGAPATLVQGSSTGQWGTNSAGSTRTMSSFGLRKSLQMNSWGGPVENEASGPSLEAQWEQASTNQPLQQQSPIVGLTGSQVGSGINSVGSGLASAQQWGTPLPNLNFDKGLPMSSTPDPGWPQMSPSASLNQSMPAWPENMADRQGASQALLPVIYQEPQANDLRQSTVALQLIPQNALDHLLPQIAEVPQPVHMPVVFTNPRPLTPRYRVFSGTLSVLIVALLLCGGVGYYAQSSGILGNVVRMFTNQPPPSVQVASAQRLPNPPDKIDSGPAAGIIPSGTTTLRIDGANLPLETDKVFTVGQPFYVTYTVQPPAGQQGRVSVKWYMNGKLYNVVTSDLIQGDKTSYGSHQMQYLIPAEGSVEVYWNDQLAQRFYFVVQPAK